MAMYDMFMIPAIIHENSTKMCKPEHMAKIADAFSSGDVFHTYMYQTQAWDMSETYCALTVLYPSRFFKVPASVDDVDYSTYMNKISNISVRRNMIERLSDSLGKDSIEQVYVAYKLSKLKKNMVKPQIMSLKRFFES